MTQDEQKRAGEFIENNVGNCPNCGNIDYVLTDNFITPQIWNSEHNQPQPGATVPFIAISCDTCWHTMFFHTKHADIIKQ